jgi:hypothetical protein
MKRLFIILAAVCMADEAAWRVQKDQPGGKKTFYQYIFNLEYDKLRS